jgi:hypothetical protein
MEPKRCRHCAGRLTSLQIDGREEFAISGPALVCARCDGAAPEGESAFVPPYSD